MSLAYGADKGPRYGAAVLTTTGERFAAGQYRAETRQISIHAEQAALIHAASHGQGSIIAIAIVSDESDDDFTNPCGICKQMLYENALRSGNHLTVILATLTGRTKVLPLAELIVYPWPETAD
jgi:cytidine deaminase